MCDGQRGLRSGPCPAYPANVEALGPRQGEACGPGAAPPMRGHRSGAEGGIVCAQKWIRVHMFNNCTGIPLILCSPLGDGT